MGLRQNAPHPHQPQYHLIRLAGNILYLQNRDLDLFWWVTFWMHKQGNVPRHFSVSLTTHPPLNKTANCI
ncbi:hypothetical protein XENTR_v10016979 [Xenopus tropicalis]|nr:hypothetical protein XENTR_v10016979 [Xenopus tropicalis]